MLREELEPSSFSPDVCDFLRLLHRHGVKYLIVGGEAVIYHGYARLTGDIDFFFEASAENCERLFMALSEFWEGSVPGLAASDELLRPGLIVQFGVPPNRIDLLNLIGGVTFGEAWPNRRTVMLKGEREEVQIYYLGLEDLIRNKRAAGRHKDLDDLHFLESVRKSS